MSRSERAQRKEKIMTMTARGPTLIPIPARSPKTYFDSQKIPKGKKNQYEQLINEMLQTKQIECLTQKDYFNILAILREKRSELTRQERLAECIEIDDLMAQLSDYFFENKLYTSKSEEVAIIEAQLEAVENKLYDAEEKWRNEMIKKYRLKARDENRKQNLTIKNLQEYDRKMENELPPEYCKVTPSTLELHERERHLAGSRRFREANEAHKEFEKAQKKDLQKRREDYAKYFETGRQEVVRRNEKIMNACESNWETKISHAEFLKNKEIQPLLNSVAVLKRKLIGVQAEYIGEDDPIIRQDDLKRTLTRTERDFPRKVFDVTTKKMSETMQKQNRNLDSTRWPPKPRQ